MKLKLMVCLILPIFVLSGCTAYKTQYTGFRPPEGYPGYQVVNGVTIGGEAYAGKSEAEQAFGFDIKGAGLLPAQVVIDNKSGQNLEIVAAQTFLVDDEGRYWNIIPTAIAIDRLDKSTQMAAFFGKGAAIGVAGGALIGGTQEGTSPEREYRITDDIRAKSIEGKVIPSDYLANGFLFFPGEANSARELRLQYREKESGRVHTVVLKLKQSEK